MIKIHTARSFQDNFGRTVHYAPKVTLNKTTNKNLRNLNTLQTSTSPYSTTTSDASD